MSYFLSHNHSQVPPSPIPKPPSKPWTFTHINKSIYFRNVPLFLPLFILFLSLSVQAISQQDLVHMAIQIACGMSYLARREVIHKDLAARNCV